MTKLNHETKLRVVALCSKGHSVIEIRQTFNEESIGISRQTLHEFITEKLPDGNAVTNESTEGRIWKPL